MTREHPARASDAGGVLSAPSVRAGTALDFETDGAVLYQGAALSLLPALADLAAGHAQSRAGIRLHGDQRAAAIIHSTDIRAIVNDRLDRAARPVRAILFDKTPVTNWGLAWHQDRTIAVSTRHEMPGYGPWSLKAGLQHVEPPFNVIESMLTLRIHLDDTPIENAPLIIAPGSHRMGKVPEPAIASLVAQCGSYACLADAGDVWAYATPILHASNAALAPRHRRVLQVDFSARTLPAPLEWLGI